MNNTRFISALIVLVLGAIILAEGILGSITGGSLFFKGVDSAFKVVVGFISILLAAAVLQDSGKQ